MLYEETAFASLIGGSFIPALNITAPVPVGPGFMKLLQSVMMAVVLSFISFSSLVENLMCKVFLSSVFVSGNSGPTLFIFVKFLQKVPGSVSILILLISIFVSPVRCESILVPCLGRFWSGEG